DLCLLALLSCRRIFLYSLFLSFFILFLGRLWDESGGYAPGHGDSFFMKNEEWLTPLGTSCNQQDNYLNSATLLQI
ncbi:MAG: hypothetical protein U0K56_06255, partial [Bacteroidaceae bacterium]|nr:hypothetical protein [Bacteroidaceae bacterium]